FLDEVGVARIQRRVAGLMSRLRAALADIPRVHLRTPPPGEWTTGIVSFSVDGIGGRELSARLRQANLVQRAAMMVAPEGGVRISLALYTDEAEIDHLIKTVHQIAAD